jgi:hypothetical protein
MDLVDRAQGDPAWVDRTTARPADHRIVLGEKGGVVKGRRIVRWSADRVDRAVVRMAKEDRRRSVVRRRTSVASDPSADILRMMGLHTMVHRDRRSSITARRPT